MKKLLLFVALATFPLFGFTIDLSISLASFKSSDQTYVEIYMHLAGKSVQYENIDSTRRQATVEVLLFIKKEGQVLLADKYNLNSPVSEINQDFLDQRRYLLDPGHYALEVTVKDLNDTLSTATYQQAFDVDFSDAVVQQSDIELLGDVQPNKGDNNPFKKGRLILEPLPTHFLAKERLKVLFYNELYSDAVQRVAIRYFINRMANDIPTTLKIENQERLLRSATTPLVLSLDIKDIPSGNYELVLEVRDTANALLSAKSVTFQRSNPYSTPTTLTEEVLEEEIFVKELGLEELELGIEAIIPRLERPMVENANDLVQVKDTAKMRVFLFNYWVGQNPNLPKIAYQKYMEVVAAVDREFRSGFRKGFETDRGYIYLKFGQPDDITRVEDEPTVPPYEIWSYNYFPTTQQNNVRFLFYNPSLAAEEFVLLHSTARGQLNNPRWEIDLYRNSPNEVQGDDPFGATEMQDGFGRRARRLMTDY